MRLKDILSPPAAKPLSETDLDETMKDEDDPCWDGYEMVGMKKKDGKSVPNCVPKKGKKS